jgi:predicted nucleic acid-binding protein
MILVDTSVWIEVLRGRSRDAFAAAAPPSEIVTCLPIVQEVLQGFDSDLLHHVASEAFREMMVLEDPIRRSLVDDAVALYRSARRAGVTVRSSVDCLIAACAIRHGATVLHLDRDFDNLQRVHDGLRTARFARRW